jgi:hypothetical protein
MADILSARAPQPGIRAVRGPAIVVSALAAAAPLAWAQPVRGVTDWHPTAHVNRIAPSEAPVIDGDLSDPAWAKATVIDDLRQRQPDTGAAPTERTVVRVMYDQKNLYFGIYAYDAHPDQIIVHSMARDGAIGTGDNINLILDPGLTRRNAYSFQVGPTGGRVDGLRLNNTIDLKEWNAIWIARARIVSDGWVAEVAIPFRSVSYLPGHSDWGFILARNILHKNESDRWSSINPALPFTDQSEEGVLTGISGIDEGLGLDLQPYVAFRAKHDWSGPRSGAALGATLGGNTYYRITPGLTGTLTVNPDFSDAPLDIRQVNTTRFSLFLPETRQFFLQDAASFEFGGRLFRRDPDDTKSNNGRPFFSRNLGLVDGRPVSLIGGGKLSGEYRGFEIGALSVYTDRTPFAPGQLLSVLRVTHPVFSDSALGFVFTNGDPTGLTHNTVAGGDFQYRDTTTFNGNTFQADLYYEESLSNSVGDDNSFGLALSYPNEPWFGDFTLKQVGTNFMPALGFVNRPGIRLYDATAGYRWRYRTGRLRTFELSSRQQLYASLDGTLQSRASEFGTELVTAANDDVQLQLIDSYEHLSQPFAVPNAIAIPAGGYSWTNIFAHLETASARPVSLLAEVTCCSYYDGRNYQGHFQLSLRPNAYYELQATYDPSFIWLPEGNVGIYVLSLNATLNFTPDMQISAQAQYDNISKSFGFLARYRWEFIPGSDVLIAIGQSALIPGGQFEAQTTQASIRITHTLRF